MLGAMIEIDVAPALKPAVSSDQSPRLWNNTGSSGQRRTWAGGGVDARASRRRAARGVAALKIGCYSWPWTSRHVNLEHGSSIFNTGGRRHDRGCLRSG